MVRETMQQILDLTKSYQSNAEDMESTIETIRHLAFQALMADTTLEIPDFMIRKEGAA